MSPAEPVNERTPILDRLIGEGSIRVDGTTLIGIASDGVEVSLGQTFARAAAERYLTDFPTPDVW